MSEVTAYTAPLGTWKGVSLTDTINQNLKDYMDEYIVEAATELFTVNGHAYLSSNVFYEDTVDGLIMFLNRSSDLIIGKNFDQPIEKIIGIRSCSTKRRDGRYWFDIEYFTFDHTNVVTGNQVVLSDLVASYRSRYEKAISALSLIQKTPSYGKFIQWARGYIFADAGIYHDSGVAYANYMDPKTGQIALHGEFIVTS